MPNKEPLDMSQFVDDDIDTEYQLDITKPSETKPQLEIPPERNPKYAKMLEHELDEEIAKYEHYIKTLNIDPEKLKRAIEVLQKEKLVRECENKRKEQADGSGSQSKDHVAIGTAFSEECVLLNPSKEKGSFTKRSSNTEASPVCGRKNASRIFSGDLAGPSPRPGLRSGSKRCSRCGGSSIDSTCNACRFYRKPPKRHFAAKESPERNSSPGSGKGNGGKKARQSVGGEYSPGTVVELCSSDDEEVKVTQETSADCQIPSQRKVYGTRSTLSPSMEGVRIAYPSRDDPEAVEVAWHDLHRLEPMEFLNDTVIDFYIKYIQRPEVLTQEDKSKFYFFNSFFYKKLTELVGGQNKKTLADLTKLRKWTKGTNIFEKEYLFVPIHDKWHWSLAIVCHPGATSEDTCSQRCILHLDSMSPGHKSNNVFRLLRTYLIAEWEHQADKDDSRDFVEKLKNEDFPVKKIPVPQQENESDCGLFLLHYIERFLKEAPSAFKLSDVDQLRLFGRNWFKPSQASGLRQEIQQLLLSFFEKEASRARENAETIERSSVQHQEPENMILNNVQQVNHSDVEVNNASCFPGQCLAAERVHEHNVPAPSTPKFDSAGCSTPPGLLVECIEHHLDGEGKRFSQAKYGSPRNSTQLPLASMLEFSADFVSGDSVLRRKSLSGGLVDNSEEVNILLQSNNNNRDVGEDNNNEIPLVVDLPIQDEQRSAD